MSSFKGFLRNGKPTAAELIGSLNASLTAMSRDTFGGREDELAGFRESMLALARNIHEQASSTEVESTVSQALELFRNYNDRTSQFHKTHTLELKAVMRTMTDTITYLSESRTRSVHQLQFMERELEQASQIDDIRLLRSRVISCLDVVREETVRLQSEAQTRSHEVREQLNRGSSIQEPLTPFDTMDSVTGLPGRRTAERAISDSVKSGGDHAVAVFAIQRLSAINSKYGRSVGDEVMLHVANRFAQHLSSATFLFRWSGPALVALISANSKADEIKRTWGRVAAIKQEVNLDSKQRTVFVLAETSMWFQNVTQDTQTEDLFQAMDRYVAEQTNDLGRQR